MPKVSAGRMTKIDVLAWLHDRNLYMTGACDWTEVRRRLTWPDAEGQLLRDGMVVRSSTRSGTRPTT